MCRYIILIFMNYKFSPRNMPSPNDDRAALGAKRNGVCVCGNISSTRLHNVRRRRAGM